MRHPLVQRLISLLLLAGVTAAVLPFGRDAVMRERWLEWVDDVAPEAHHAALRQALLEVIGLHPGVRPLLQALVLRDDADPAWFGLEAFSPEAVRQLEQQMEAVPMVPPLQPLLVQGYAAPSVPLAVPVGLIASRQTGSAYLPVRVVKGRAEAPPAAIAPLTGTRISPRAP